MDMENIIENEVEVIDQKQLVNAAQIAMMKMCVAILLIFVILLFVALTIILM